MSDDGKLLAYATDTTGFRQYELHVKDLTQRPRRSPTRLQRVTSVEWAADNKTLFLTTEDPVTEALEPAVAARAGPGATRSLLYEEQDELFRVHVGRTRDKKFLLMQITCGDTQRDALYAGRPSPRPSFACLPRARKGIATASSIATGCSTSARTRTRRISAS